MGSIHVAAVVWALWGVARRVGMVKCEAWFRRGQKMRVPEHHNILRVLSGIKMNAQAGDLWESRVRRVS